jgi:ATP-dependent DNA ligase
VKLKKVVTIDETPKFEGWDKERYLRAGINSIDVQTCKEYDKKYIDKYQGLWLCQTKYDGFRCICIVTEEGNRFFSRRISKKTNWWAENTDNVPHLRDLKGIPVGTILDGEFIHPANFSSVQSVIGSLTPKAIQFQKDNGWLEYHVFDLLQHGDDNYEHMDYVFRLSMLQANNFFGFNKVETYVESNSKSEYHGYPHEVSAKDLKKYRGVDVIEVESFDKLRDEMWDKGLEGLVLKLGSSKYEQGKRSPHWLKVKSLITKDCVVTGFQEPTKEYDGKTLGDKGYWDYWEDKRGIKLEARMTLAEANSKNLLPVTKPYAKNWIGAIIVGVFRDEKMYEVAELKGIDDATQEYIKANRKKLIGNQVVEFKCQQIINQETGSVRHPRFNRWRVDRSPESCTWESYIEG